jgi:hypothetical protein
MQTKTFTFLHFFFQKKEKSLYRRYGGKHLRHLELSNFKKQKQNMLLKIQTNIY